MTTDLRIKSGSIAEALDRQERRRGRGLPTVSVLAGPVGLALREARAWAGAQGRSTIQVADPDPDAMLDAWVSRLFTENDLTRVVIAWLARRLGRPEVDLGCRLGRMTPFEREAFLDEVLADAAGTGLDIVGRHLLASPAHAPPPAPESMTADLVAAGLPRPLLARILLELVPERSTPLVLIAACRSEDPGGPALGCWAELAARLVESEPGLTVVLAVDARVLDEYLGEGVESRARALLRESIVPVPTLAGATLRRRLDDTRPGLADALAGPAARLEADGASEALVDALGAAALAAEEVARGGLAADQARSAAERFLFDRLESLPKTAGLFRLNGRPGFPFGAGQPMEVDLLAVDLRMAIEIDGYYHFQNADAYRRDRRKDLELQRWGYLVVRILAEDVVPRLEEILETILDAVTHQARPSPRS